MNEEKITNEQAIIDEILRRKGRQEQEKLIPAEKMKVFKAKLGEEIERTGNLRQEFVDDLLRRLKNGEL